MVYSRAARLTAAGKSGYVAAIDLGSNSFHMIVGQIREGELFIVDRLRERVRLASGLNKDNTLTDEIMTSALDCLARFGQRLATFQSSDVRIVGTNTLRQARNSAEFLARAEECLGYPVDIIAGVEEARLIYQGVSHGISSEPDEYRRLVMDIGGGSTELIIGKGVNPQHMESLYMGCVSYTRKYFSKGVINNKSIKRCELAARMELEPVEALYRKLGWDKAIGASGTIRAIREVVREAGWSDEGITLDSLKQLRDAMLEMGHIDKLQLKGLTSERAMVFPGGAIILLAVFKALNIERLQVSDSALREGLIYDLLGRSHQKDVRSRAISNLVKRYHVDMAQARRVTKTAIACAKQVAKGWDLPLSESRLWLTWSAQLHEIGLDIAHSQYHKHGAYIAEFADLAGFSRQEQLVLATLVASHRRKFAKSYFNRLAESRESDTRYWAILLRLSVLLHRSRSTERLPKIILKAEANRLSIQFPAGWLDSHHLTLADLEEEAEFHKAIGFELNII